MDKDFYNDDLNHYLRESADAFKLYPSDRVWEGIEKKLHPSRRWPYLAAAMLLFGLGVGTGMLLEDENHSIVSDGILKDQPAVSSGVTANSTKNFSGSDNKENIPGSLATSAILRRNQVENPSPLSKIERPFQTVPDLSLGSELPAQVTGAMTRITADTKIEENKPGTLKQNGPELAKVVPLYGSQSMLKDARSKKSTLDPQGSGYLLESLSRIAKKTGLQLYFSPSISYRKLVGQATKSNFSYSSFPYSANLGFPSDVNDAVTHKPALGIELGSAINYPLNRNFRLKAGLQINLNNYEVEAYRYSPEIAPFSANGPMSFGQQINTVSYYRNFSGFSRTWLRNSHFMVSMPLGIEMTLAGKRRVNLNIASTIQPTYVINNRSYLISTNLKNYAQEPSLYRRWNLNAGAEAYVTVNMGSYKWMLGPQVRYQVLSSYKDKYPIREYLIDYGFKLGIQKTLK